MILAAIVTSFVVASAASASANQARPARPEVRKGPVAKLVELERRKNEWLRQRLGR
jgi:hypothetical protein